MSCSGPKNTGRQHDTDRDAGPGRQQEQGQGQQTQRNACLGTADKCRIKRIAHITSYTRFLNTSVSRTFALNRAKTCNRQRGHGTKAHKSASRASLRSPRIPTSIEGPCHVQNFPVTNWKYTDNVMSKNENRGLLKPISTFRMLHISRFMLCQVSAHSPGAWPSKADTRDH